MPGPAAPGPPWRWTGSRTPRGSTAAPRTAGCGRGGRWPSVVPPLHDVERGSGGEVSPPRILFDVRVEIDLRLGDRQQLRLPGDEEIELGVVCLERGRDQAVTREVRPPLALETELEHALAQDAVPHFGLCQAGRPRSSLAGTDRRTSASAGRRSSSARTGPPCARC